MEEVKEMQHAAHPNVHTAEHILNCTMHNMFGCPRSKNAHLDRKKSKCDYILSCSPTEEEVRQIEEKVNDIIDADMPVTYEFMSKESAAEILDLSKLPDDASEQLRIVKIGDYDICACIGAHVSHTAEIGKFKIISHDYSEGIWRLRWKIVRNDDSQK